MPIEEKAGKAATRVTRKKSGEERVVKDEAEEVGRVRTEEPLCNVGYSLKTTKNLGNYESVSVDVSIHVPCKQEDVDEAFEACEQWVHEKVDLTLGNLGIPGE